MEYYLLLNPWIGMILWTLIYISDYGMTIASARKYRTNSHFEFEGSFELTPQFEKDVDALYPISRRHLLMLLLTNGMLLIFWWLFSRIYFLHGYLFVLGILILVEVGVHIRHFRTFHLLYMVEIKGGLEGKISYRRWLMFSTSAMEFFLFFVLFLITSILTNSYFFFGGSISCLSLAINHHRKYRTLYKQPDSEPVVQA
ncbi:MAG: hypothetical protein FJZ87_03685 [Chloroflexi bacterium]|nr:hypothetical protein [Chloroflexota bacterium]